jgi:uncharacterized protein
MSPELFDAIGKQDVKRVAALLSRGADPNAALAAPPHWRPLEAAIEEVSWYDGPLEIVRLLLQAGADPNAWDDDNRITPLHSATRANNRETIRLMLEAGADPNLVSDEGESAMRWAVEQGDLEIAAMCVRSGAGKTINAFGGFCGYTPLAMAARKLDVEMIKLLLDAGADPGARDEDDRTAVERLPARETSKPDAWDKAMALLSPRTFQEPTIVRPPT